MLFPHPQHLKNETEHGNSLIVPIYNEVENLPILVGQLVEVSTQLPARPKSCW